MSKNEPNALRTSEEHLSELLGPDATHEILCELLTAVATQLFADPQFQRSVLGGLLSKVALEKQFSSIRQRNDPGDLRSNVASSAVPNIIPRPDRLMRLPEVLRLTGVSRSTLYTKIKRGTFPKQESIGPNMSAWYESEVLAWVQNPS